MTIIKKILKFFLYTVAGLFAGMLVLIFFANTLFRITPPETNFTKNITYRTSVHIQTNNNTVYTTLGKARMWRNGGIRQVYSEGSPYEIGYTLTRLCADKMHVQEKILLEAGKDFVPSSLMQALMIRIIHTLSWFVEKNIPAEYLEEIYGSSMGYENRHPGFGNLYQRLIFYHSLHDFAHLFMDTPLVERKEDMVGCTAFGVKGSYTTDGRMLCGRNFDFDVHSVFDEDKVVFHIRPEKGIPFTSVSWGGMTGAMTGVNTEKLFVAINAIRTSDTALWGYPTSLVVRQILQYAHNIPEAITILKNARIFVSDLFFIADGKNNIFAVIEKTPTRMHVNYYTNDSVIVPNHILSGPFTDDPENIAQKLRNTTVQRYERMKELLSQNKGKINYLLAASIMRDRRGQGGKNLGNGNRNTINALIATHGVIFDGKHGILWISDKPHLLGSFYPADPFTVFDQRTHTPPGITIIPQDPFLNSGYQNYLEYKETIRQVRNILDSGKAADFSNGLLPAIHRCKEINPFFFEVHETEGDLLHALGIHAEAVTAYKKALEAFPHFFAVRERIKNKIKVIEEQNY